MSEPYFAMASEYGIRRKRRRDLAADQREDLAHQRLDDAEDRLRPRERHLDVHLRELGLTVSAQILVAEALADLHVAVHARDHQDLLEQLRRLRQREELAGMHAARHEIVARAFRRGLRQNRRLDLEEAVLVEVAPHDRRQTVTHDDVVLQPRTTKIEIAILQAYVFRHRRVVGDRKRRCLCLVQHHELLHDDLDLAGRQLRIHRLGRAAPHFPDHADHELGSQPLGLGNQRLVVFVEDDLRDPGAVADVDEEQPAEIAHAMHPAQKRRVRANVRPAAVRRRCACGSGRRVAQPRCVSPSRIAAPAAAWS